MTRQGLFAFGLVLAATVALACGQVGTIEDCEAADGIVPICGFVNPEDIVQIPRTPWLVVSQFGEHASGGGLVGYRNPDGRRRALYPGGPDGGALSASGPVPGWGDPACPGPPDLERFSPHGIDVRAEGSYHASLAVVNHGGREAIELFEVGYAAGGPALGWRGCIPLPAQVWGNDVAFGPEGELLVTQMMRAGGTLTQLGEALRMAVGANTGRVFEWNGEDGLRAIEGSEGCGNNGIAVSRDGRDVYFAEWGASRLVRLRRGEPDSREAVDLPHRPDNLSWSRDGRLLVAGQVGGLGEVLGCAGIESGTCALPFSVLSVEPAGLGVETVLEAEPVAMGAVSSALEVGDTLFLGTFAGDRIARREAP